MSHRAHLQVEGGRDGWVGGRIGKKQLDEIFVSPLSCAQISGRCQEDTGELLSGPCPQGNYLEEELRKAWAARPRMQAALLCMSVTTSESREGHSVADGRSEPAVVSTGCDA